MYKRHLPAAFVGISFVFLFILSCTKLDTTSLGEDLIPEVDNINTFADTFEINTSQLEFNPDTSTILYTDGHALGHIESDPLFGKTDAAIYFQLKPSFYPYYWGAAGDTTRNTGGPGVPTLPSNIVGLDSVYLCLSYISSYGDTTTPLQLEVRTIVDDKFRLKPGGDTTVQYQPQSEGPVIGTETVDIRTLKNQIKFANGKDSVTNQVRIKITDAAFLNSLYNADSSGLGAFKNDSLFRDKFNGLAVKPVGSNGNALMYISLTNAKTRLEIHYRKRKGANLDTTYSTFLLYPTISTYGPPSSTANSVVRNRAGFPVSAGIPDYLFLQTNPGTYATLKVPGLDTLSNNIIHRATILMESVPDNPITDSIFGAPAYLYLDLKDTSSPGVEKWKPVYHDLNTSTLYDPDFKSGYPFFPLSGVDPTTFGGNARYKKDAQGRSVVFYNINITRYVQQIVTKQTPNYPMRLWPAYSVSYPQYSKEIIPYYNPIAAGRVRLASGSFADKNKKMRLVVIYSKIP